MLSNEKYNFSSSLGNFVTGSAAYSAGLRLFNVESDINGILPARGRAPAIYFVSPLEQASLCTLG